MTVVTVMLVKVRRGDWQVTCPVAGPRLAVSSAMTTGEPASVWNLLGRTEALGLEPDSLQSVPTPPLVCISFSAELNFSSS